MDARVALLERRMRQLQIAMSISLAAVLGLGVYAWAGRPERSVIRARAFAVVDERGSVVATLANEPHGPLLRFQSEGRADSHMVVGRFGPNIGLIIYDEKGKGRATLSAGSEGTAPALTFSDATGKTRFSAGTDSDESGSAPLMLMRDSKFRARLYLRVGEEPVFVFRDEVGKSVWGYRAPDLP